MTAADDAVVLVTPRSFPEAGPEALAELSSAVAEVRVNETGRRLDDERLRAALADVDGVIAGLERFDAATIAAAPRLRAIARYGIGVDRVDLDAAAAHGVTVTNTPGANATAVAELTIGLILAALRRIPRLDAGVRAGEWPAGTGSELGGRTVGLIGLGRIGAGVAARARGFGCAVLAADPALTAADAAEVGAELVELEELLARADVLSLHAPVTATTRDLVDGELLARLPRGALLVNAARGELVVERDLIAALDSGRLAGAALDSLRAEPPPADHPLLGRDDVIVTPHVGAHTAEASAAMARESVVELLAVLRGERPRYPVTSPAGARR